MPASLPLPYQLKMARICSGIVGCQDTRKVMPLPLYHFLHFNVETEESSVHVLKLGDAKAGVIMKEGAGGKTTKEEQAKEVRLDEAQRPEDVERGRE